MFNIEAIDPILNRTIETINAMYPKNKGVLLMIGVIDNEDLCTSYGTSEDLNFENAAKIAFSCIGDVNMDFGNNEVKKL